MSIKKVELYVSPACRSMVRSVWLNDKSKGWAFTPTTVGGQPHMTFAVTKMGLTQAGVAAAGGARLCLQLVGGCTSLPAFCGTASGSCRYALFNADESCCPVGSASAPAPDVGSGR